MYNAADFFGGFRIEAPAIITAGMADGKGHGVRKRVHRHRWLGALLLASAIPSTAASPSVAERYGNTCAVCHANGASGAPKAGDADAWQRRIAKGMDVMVASARHGLRAMPPKGMCFDCSDDDFRALIEYMTTPQAGH